MEEAVKDAEAAKGLVSAERERAATLEKARAAAVEVRATTCRPFFNLHIDKRGSTQSRSLVCRPLPAAVAGRAHHGALEGSLILSRTPPRPQLSA